MIWMALSIWLGFISIGGGLDSIGRALETKAYLDNSYRKECGKWYEGCNWVKEQEKTHEK